MNIDFKTILFSKENNRLTAYPPKDKDIWNLYKKQQQLYWIPEEIKLSQDISDWKKLTINEQNMLKLVLAFFATSDGIVSMNLTERFINDIELTEVKMFYRFQAMMEDIHSEVYSKLIEEYIIDKNEKNKLFNAINEIECVKNKANWAIKWINCSDSFEKRLLAFAIVEGIYFSGSFCIIYWFAERNLLKGLVQSNEFISRDEGIHTDFAILLYNKINNKLNEKIVYEIFDEAVEIEKQFIKKMLPTDLIGMNYKLMSEYIEFVADNLLQDLNYSKKYKSSNPFSFMNKINIPKTTNFFENHSTQYSKITNSNNIDADNF